MKKKEVELFWDKLVATYFDFCKKKFNGPPSFDGSSPRDLKNIVTALRVRAAEKKIDWDEASACARLEKFLEYAYADDFLRRNFILSIINRQKDKIFFSTLSASDSAEVFFLRQMLSVWAEKFPTYTCQEKLDFPALRKIIEFMCEAPPYGLVDEEIKVLNTLQLIADEISVDRFWINKTLGSIANNIQEFYNRIKLKTNGPGKKGTNRATIDGVKRKHAEHYGSGG